MEISTRLKTVADFVLPCDVVADIGTDHGFIPIYLIHENRVKQVIAMDLRKGPIERAKANILEYGYESQIQLRLSDGLDKLLKKEADAITIAGMGGELMSRILEDGKEIVMGTKQLVLQPQSEIYKVRKKVKELGFRIDKEDFIKCSGKEYIIIHCVPGIEIYVKDCDYEYGGYMLTHPNELFIEYMKRQYIVRMNMIEKLNHMESENAKKRVENLKKELVVIKEAFTYNEMQRFSIVPGSKL